MNLRKSINLACAHRGVKKAYTAEKAQTSPSHLSRIIKANRCSTDTLEKIAKALGYKVSEFIALGEEEKAA